MTFKGPFQPKAFYDSMVILCVVNSLHECTHACMFLDFTSGLEEVFLLQKPVCENT